MTEHRRDALRELLKASAAALVAGQVRFALCGGYALWAHGAPEPTHDADLMVAEEDLGAAVDALRSAGLTVTDPPEDWLVKVVGEPVTDAGEDAEPVFVDVIHRSNGVDVAADTIARAEEFEVLSVTMPVLPPTDVFVMRLLALSDHFCDFTRLLPGARAVRERIDWDRLRDRTTGNDYARAFLYLVDRLGIAPSRPEEAERPGA